MEITIVKLDHEYTKTTPCYGGTTTTAYYYLTTECEGIKNTYEIVAEIRGIATGDLYMNLLECTPTTNNENTLTFEAIQDLLEW